LAWPHASFTTVAAQVAQVKRRGAPFLCFET
jgi:hypothetical protein